MYKSIIKPTLVLVLIGAIVGGLLAVTYNLTGVAELAMAGLSQEELDTFQPNVLPDASSLERADVSLDDEAFLGAYADEGGSGVAIHVVGKGYEDGLKLLVGIAGDGTVAGVVVTESGETPGIGSKIADDPSFMAQFVGKGSGSTALTADGGEINGIAGATYSSRGAANLVTKALEIYEQIKGEVA